jgi:hypothetical protein
MRSRRFVVVPFVLGVALLGGCSSSDGASAVPAPPEPEAGCNPIIGDDCLTPFPSTFHLKTDASSATGYRVNIAAKGALPLLSNGVQLEPTRINQKDGFSAATQFLAYFKAGVDGSAFFGWKDPSPSLTATSPVQVIEYDTGKRVLAFAELDGNATTVDDRQAVIVHPLVHLKPKTRYVIALVGLKDKQGNALTPAPFKALRDGTTLSKALEPLKPRYDEIFSVLDKAGVKRADLTVAWDLVTASDETATGHLVKMRDYAFAELAAGHLSYKIVKSTDSTDAHMLRQIEATVQVPSYLADDSGKSMMVFDDQGQPKPRAVVDVPIVINVPRCAATATKPIPVTVFGHGLFGNAKDTMSGDAAMAAGDSICTIFVGTDWIGLSSADIGVLPDLLTSNLNNFYVISDRLQQAQLNALVMTRMFLTKIKDDPALALSSKAITDGKEVYYFGVSNGGIQGTTFMALTPDIPRGVLNVPGSVWSLMLWRSADLGRFGGLLSLLAPDALERMVAITVTQPDWDYTDPASFAPHLLSNPLPGVPVKKILVQESIDDAQVPNVATRILARTMGLTGLDLYEPVPGLETGSAPLDSAYTQWNSHPKTVPPLDDTRLDSDNGAHDSVWKAPLALQQIEAFCKPDGKVTSVCGGKCDLPTP